jgi:WD40 repeat protein
MPDHVVKFRFPHAHTGTIFSLLSLTELDVVASASADTTVCIWDLHKESLVQRLTGHKKGVLALGFCAPQRLLVSGGYDHNPCVYSPFVNMLLHRLVGHTAPVTSVQGVVNRPEIVTGDTHGVVKIWDLRNYK